MLRGVKILFVCLGNICRSPTAEAVTRHLAENGDLPEGLDGESFEFDSAGTGNWHVGDPPDSRSAAAAAGRGMPLGGAARQVSRSDFLHFDLLIAMDRVNRDDLLALAPDDETAGKVRLMREFADGPDLDVPDPYYGGPNGFEEVLDIVERNARALLESVATES